MDRIGPYHIEERLGRGGMGEIFRAFDTKNRRDVAIKTIQSRLAEDDQTYRRFAREMKLASRMHHPSIVEVYEVLHVTGGACVVMELVDGFTLKDALSCGPLGLQDSLHIAQKVCDGLVEAHSHYIVHRDIKAENVMISRQNEVKILDFGLARAIDGDIKDQSKTLTRTGMIVGSAGSMAPEQILGEPVDPRTDLFSLGCLIYRMLSGQSPFYSRSFVHTLAAITSTPHRPLVRAVPSIPPAVSHLVDRMLEKLPENRQQSSEEAQEELSALVTEHGPIDFKAAALAPGNRRASSQVIAEPSDSEASVDVSMILGISPPREFFAQPEFGAVEFQVGGGREIEEAFELCQERLDREIQNLTQRVERIARWRTLIWLACASLGVAGVGALIIGSRVLGLGFLAAGVALGLLVYFGFDYRQTRLGEWGDVRRRRRAYASQWLSILRDIGGISDGWSRARRERQLTKAFTQRVEKASEDC